MSDNRLSLVADGPRLLELHNNRLGRKETFHIHTELGRGGSCIVYRANVFTENGPDRPVLLKECYPFICASALCRNSDTGELQFDQQASEYLVRRFSDEKERFEHSCKVQQEIYREFADESADELMDIEDMYTAGETLYVLLHAGSGISWSSLTPRSPDESISQLLETVNSTALELAVYHRAGWLYSDMKPENVYLFRKTRQHVRLLDFGSMQKLHDGCLLGTSLISCSTEYAAPEMLDALEADEADRADYCACITPKSDVYSLCAVFYERLTGRLRKPQMTDSAFDEELDETLETLWQRERKGWLRNIHHALMLRIKQLLSHGLSWNPEFRPDPTELAEQLQELMVFVAPQRFELSAQCQVTSAISNFVGRRRELQQLKALLHQDNRLIWICGDGGLGKSELALRLAQEERRNYDFFRVIFREDLKQTILSLPVLPHIDTAPPSFHPENRDDKYNQHLQCLRQYGETGVLIIDQFDVPPEKESFIFNSPAYADLKSLRMPVIFTSRRRPPSSDSYVELGCLNQEDLIDLFRAYCAAEVKKETILEVIRRVHHNTLLTELAAKALEQSWGKLTPQQLLDVFSGGPETSAESVVGQRIQQIFDLTLLSPLSRRLMAQSCLFPEEGITAWICLECHSESEQDRLRLLELSGWLRKTNGNLLTVHPLIREACLSSLAENFETCASFLTSYENHLLMLPHHTQTENQYQYAEILSRAASCLPDPEGSYAQRAGEVNYSAGMYLTAYKNLLLYWEKLLARPPVNSQKALSTLEQLASCALNMGWYDEAAYYEISGIQVFSSLEGKNHPLLAGSYENLGAIHRTRGDFEEALNCFERAASLLPASEHLTENRAHLLLNTAKLLVQLSRYNEAKAQLQNALAYYESLSADYLPHAELRASVFTTMGTISDRCEDYSSALKYFELATQLYERLHGASHLLTASSYTNLGTALVHMERYNQAQLYLEKALAIKLSFNGLYHPTTATTYHNLSELYMKLGKPGPALEACEKAERIRRRFLRGDHPDLAKNLELHAAILYNAGIRRDEMLRCQLQAFLMHYQIESMSLEKPETAKSFTNLQTMYLAADHQPDHFMSWFEVECQKMGIHF